MSDTELFLKPKPEPVRRLEVFTGAGRGRWTAEQKARIPVVPRRAIPDTQVRRKS
jgi:hypothetical protein